MNQELIFEEFRLDLDNERLVCGQQALSLRPKSFNVLRYLLERPGKLVRKDDLLDALWPDTIGTDTLLKGCIKEIRQVLGDLAAQPRFIETAHRRGYRFIGKVGTTEKTSSVKSAIPEPLRPARLRKSGGITVGRQAEIDVLEQSLDKALKSDRQVVFVTGEPGIGKTTLAQLFLENCSDSAQAFIAQGNCLEQFGAGEEYFPVLNAIRDLSHCNEEVIGPLLSRYAPSLLEQIPTLFPGSGLDNSGRSQSVRDNRMLREVIQAIEALASIRPVILVLEDLQWCDYSTLDLISALARGTNPLRLMLIATYRPVDVILSNHPLRHVSQELQLHRRSVEISLEELNPDNVGEYLNARFPDQRFPSDLASSICDRTYGHPLFTVEAIDYLASSGLITSDSGQWMLNGRSEDLMIRVPETLVQMIERRFERLTILEQRVLEAASVAGGDFTPLTLAFALDEDLIAVEEICEDLARRQQFLKYNGESEWLDGTVATRYCFSHSLYQNLLYNRIPAARRSRLLEMVGVSSEQPRQNATRELSLAMQGEQASRRHPEGIRNRRPDSGIRSNPYATSHSNGPFARRTHIARERENNSQPRTSATGQRGLSYLSNVASTSTSLKSSDARSTSGSESWIEGDSAATQDSARLRVRRDSGPLLQ